MEDVAHPAGGRQDGADATQDAAAPLADDLQTLKKKVKCYEMQFEKVNKLPKTHRMAYEKAFGSPT